MNQDFSSLFEQALKLRERIDELKMELAAKRIQVTAGDGEVILIMNGLQEVLEVTVNMGEIPTSQKTRLETLLKRAINQGIAKTRDVAGQEVFFTFSPSSE